MSRQNVPLALIEAANNGIDISARHLPYEIAPTAHDRARQASPCQR